MTKNHSFEYLLLFQKILEIRKELRSSSLFYIRINKVQEVSKRVKGFEIELTFPVNSKVAKRPGSHRIHLKVIQRKLCWSMKSLFENEYRLAPLKENPMIRKPFKINKEKFDISFNFKKEDDEIKRSLIEKQEDKIIVPKIIDEREPFVPVEEEMKFEEAEPTKKINIDKPNESALEKTGKGSIEVPIPSELGKDEINDPEVQRNLVSLLYCTERHK